MNTEIRLTDEQMRKFIAEGFLILKTDFPKEFHDQLLKQLDHVYETEGNPGNNLLPRIRELQKVFDHPVIKGALTSVLGPDYMLHAHRHGHYNNSPKPGGWHKDSYWGYYRVRNHHPWWAMIMYFPQDTPQDLGPTGVMPGTQWYETRTFEHDENQAEATAKGEAGTFALIQYDIWHRSTANILGKNRYMLKFEFMRTQAPSAPSWDNQEAEWMTPSDLSPALLRHETIWQETWNWLSGRIGGCRNAAEPASAEETAALLQQLGNGDAEARSAAADRLGRLGTAAVGTEVVPGLVRALEDSFEPVVLNAAYGLSRMGQEGTDALLQALHREEAMISRSAAYGLSAVGREAMEGLIAALDSERAGTVAHAVFALGELREEAAQAVQALTRLLNHPAETVRREVVEALGMIRTPAEEIVDGLIKCLHDQDTQVRFMAGLSLSRMGELAEKAVPELVKALDDDNRYVRAHALEALHYIGTDNAKDALIHHLMNYRWCPSTTPASTFYP